MSDAPSPPARPPNPRDDALAVVRRLREAGYVAYFAGGCVRDALLGLTPKDYDVATDAPPGRVRELFPRTQAVGAAFGVILVRQGRSQVEVATFRSDGKYVDGRRPDHVTFTTAEEDAKRRDFTINGMFFDPVEDRVIDYVGGQADVERRVLRAIGNPDARLAEDHLRMLRAVRFAARFELTVEPNTAAAIRRHATSLKRISPERIAEELRLMLCPPTRAVAWPLLWECGLATELMRSVPVSRSPTFDRQRSLVVALPARPVRFGLALAAAALCYQWHASGDDYPFDLLGAGNVTRIALAMRQTLRLSNDELDDLHGTLKGATRLLVDRAHGVAALKRFLASPTAPLTRDLLDAMEKLPGYDWRKLAALRCALAPLEHTDVAPQPLLTGDDLTAAGLKPGKVFKRVLDEVYDAQLEDRVKTKDEALALALRIAAGDA